MLAIQIVLLGSGAKGKVWIRVELVFVKWLNAVKGAVVVRVNLHLIRCHFVISCVLRVMVCRCVVNGRLHSPKRRSVVASLFHNARLHLSCPRSKASNKHPINSTQRPPCGHRFADRLVKFASLAVCAFRHGVQIKLRVSSEGERDSPPWGSLFVLSFTVTRSLPLNGSHFLTTSRL